jgi:hypothetical protein
LEALLDDHGPSLGAPKTSQAVEKVVLRVVGIPKLKPNTYKSRLKHHKSGF